ncbi:MAG: hypothetical protein BroJett033_8060 [Chloroflexota bacterium]|nr:MAG: hypothetical protein BroJett033_8060 [Chloroflexota bacterium]
MSKYAQGTSVEAGRTLTEIKATLDRYGASGFGYLETGGHVVLAFEMRGRRVRFDMPLPKPEEAKRTAQGRSRTPAAAKIAGERAIRERWRALLLTIKAKLESVESGIETFDDAFLAQLVLPSGETMGAWSRLH